MSLEQFIDSLIQHSPALIVAIPLIGAFLTPLIGKIHDKVRNGFVIFIVLFTSFIVFLLANDIYSDWGKIHTYVFGGTTALTEGITSLFGFLAFTFLVPINWELFLPLLVAILVAVPISTYIVKILPEMHLRRWIGVFVFALGLLLIIKTVIL